MSTSGIEGLYIETHNWGKTVAFWQALGYALEFETDHHSGQLVHPDGGPYLFVAERPESQVLETHPILAVDDAAAFAARPPVVVEAPFAPTHWDRAEMTVRDPDGRLVSLQAPLPAGMSAAPGHH